MMARLRDALDTAPRPSAHSSAQATKDLPKVLAELSSATVFVLTPGRHSSSFPNRPHDPFNRVGDLDHEGRVFKTIQRYQVKTHEGRLIRLAAYKHNVRTGPGPHATSGCACECDPAVASVEDEVEVTHEATATVVDAAPVDLVGLAGATNPAVGRDAPYPGGGGEDVVRTETRRRIDLLSSAAKRMATAATSVAPKFRLGDCVYVTHRDFGLGLFRVVSSENVQGRFMYEVENGLERKLVPECVLGARR